MVGLVHLQPLRENIFTPCLAKVFKAINRLDEEKEGSHDYHMGPRNGTHAADQMTTTWGLGMEPTRLTT